MSEPEQGPVRVLIVDDQALMREGLRTLLDAQEGIEVVGEAEDGLDALEKVSELGPDVALVDVRMPRMDGVELTGRLSAEHPRVAVVILTTFDDDEYVAGALGAGARGYLLKDTPSKELAEAAIRAMRGEPVLGGQIASKVISGYLRGSERQRRQEPSGAPANEDDLSEREVEVLNLVGSGATNAEIARALYISEGTAKNHVSRMLKKLGMRDRARLALYAVERSRSKRQREAG